MMTMILSGKYQAIGKSVLGATHKLNNKPCQDAFFVQEGRAGGVGYVIVCAADGHGSARCPYSDEGSEAAVVVAAELLASILDNNDKAFVNLDAHKEIWLPKQLEEHWKTQVRAIHNEKNRDAETPFAYELYGTTLLALVLTQDFAFALQIGDGDILAVTPDTPPSRLIPSVEAAGNETESLCMENSWQYVRTRIFPVQSEIPYMFWLSTDGYVNSFTEDAGFLQAGTDIFNLWNEHGKDYVESQLPDWLARSSQKGSGDDITVVMVRVTG
jgi:serine/threonine protein phosphatase PrpC